MDYLLDTMVVSALLRYELQPVERIQSLSPLTDDVLVTSDAHFSRIPDLPVEDWLRP